MLEAYSTDLVSAEQALIGYVFLTSDHSREVNGFSAPIEVLVGMDLQGTITFRAMSRGIRNSARRVAKAYL